MVQSIQLSKLAGVGTITLNRPNARNAFDREMYDLFARAIADLRLDSDIRAVVIKATEPGFSAGADVKGMAEMDSSAFYDFMTVEHAVFDSLEALDKPVIAAINGPALGGAFEIALVCDFRIASPEARFGFPEPLIGFIPPVQRLSRLISRTRAKEILFTAETIDADEAFRLGLLNRVVSKEAMDDAVSEMIERLKRTAPLAIRLAKRSALTGLDASLPTALAQEFNSALVCFGSDDLKEGMAAFRERRAPRFTGR